MEPNKAEDFSIVLDDSRLWNQFNNIEAQQLNETKAEFLWGISTCTYQDSGFFHCPDSQWADWEMQCLDETNRSGKSANLFALYQNQPDEIVRRLKALGANSYRFSIEWSHIEPKEGCFDDAKLQIYLEFCRHLRDCDIEPMVTLHHFSEPKWFHYLGSFEKETNIPYFVRFAKYVYAQLIKPYRSTPLVRLFCSINEPAIEAFNRFIMGSFSPGLSRDFPRAALFLKGALKAHCQVYRALKEINIEGKIGIVHQYLRFLARDETMEPIAKQLTHVVNEAQLNFFKTGKFVIFLGAGNDIIDEGDGTLPPTDFVGLQYYARPVLENNASTSFHEPMTLMPYREDPEGLYEAILRCYEAYKKPILITETGISTHDDIQRTRYLSRSLYAAQQAQEKIGKENLLGYYLWSFVDNLEWNMGMTPQAFGAYSLEEVQGEKRIAEHYKPGVAPFVRAATNAKRVQNTDLLNSRNQ